MNRLPILKELSRKEQFELETKKRCEELWSTGADEKLNPMLTAIGHERIKRTWALIPIKKGKRVVDLGCGSGAIATRLASQGVQVTAIDGAVQPLKLSEQKGITPIQGCLPYIPLPDQSMDGVILTDVIAEIEPHLHRLFMSEVARVLTKEGWFVCSTPLDLYSVDAHSRFFELIQTEFEITTKKESFHRLHFYLWQLLKTPSRFARAGQKSSYREQQLVKRVGLKRFWFYLNTLKTISSFWRLVASTIEPLYRRFLRNNKILTICEKISNFLWRKQGITHVIVFANKRRMF